MSISRREFIKSVITTSAAVLFGHSCNFQKNNSSPNIILFLVDDQRNDTLGCAGHPIVKTPNIDQLAENGCRFQNAFVTSPICAASRASILTSLYERTHQYTFLTPPIHSIHTAQSYPIELRNAGYQTFFSGKFGVDVEESELATMFDTYKPVSRSPYFIKQDDGSSIHETDLIAQHTLDFLKTHQKDMPFYISMHFNAPHAEDNDKKDHYPWPSSVNSLYTHEEMPMPRLNDPSIFEALPDFIKKSFNRERYFWRWDTPEKYQNNMRAYFRMISGIDGAIGKVIQLLDELNLAENTIFIYASDNGYYMGERGLAGKWSHFEESLRIPMIIYDPRKERADQGILKEEKVLNIDIPATILDLAGVNPPENYQGNSLVPLLGEKTNVLWRDEFFCEHLMDHSGIPKWEGVRGKRYVYARYYEQTPSYEFLHDLELDPDQLKNLSLHKNYQEILTRMRNKCDTYVGKYT